MIYLIILAWLSCSFLSYVFWRRAFMKYPWTEGDRIIGIGVSLLGSPLTLIIGLIIWIIDIVIDNNKKPAGW